MDDMVHVHHLGALAEDEKALMDTAPPLPLALLRGAATVMPEPAVAAIANAVLGGLRKTHPKLLSNLAGLEPAVVHVAATDLPYRFSLQLGRDPVSIRVVDRDAAGADAEIRAAVATLVDLVEGRIDSDTLFFRRDLRISGNTAVVVGLRNVLDREELSLAAELESLAGPFARPARRIARALERIADAAGRRIASMHRTLHPPATEQQDLAAELDRCHSEIAALTARLGALESRLKRRADKLA
jgi:predicted lipid carrier protein YhbT